MIRHGLFALALFTAKGAGAEPLLGPADVWSDFEYGRCDSYQVDLPCLRAAGAPEGALRFIRAAAVDPDIGMLVIPTRFTELGSVDLIEVEIPGMANTNWQEMLVNGDPSIIALASWSNIYPGNDGGTQAVLRRYPQAFPAGRVVVQGHRTLPGGIQRFVMADMLVNGCRACEPIGSSLFQIDFIDGGFMSFMDLGWVLAGPEGSTAQMAADLRAGDIALLQSLLNLRGFQAGVMDGNPGPETRSALDAFKAEHCLVGEADLSPKVIAALTEPVALSFTPPCARSRAKPLKDPLGLPDGQYVTDRRLCQSDNIDIYQELGDRSYTMSVTLTGNQFFFGESLCIILSATPRGRALDLGMACNSEGMPHDVSTTVIPQPPDALSWRGDTFRLCGTPASSSPAKPVAPVADSAGPVFPLPDSGARVNAIFGAAGPGPVSDPKAYFSGQYHAGVDLQAGADTKVRAPFDPALFTGLALEGCFGV